MIITYSHERFPDLIKAGVKIHTIRKDQGKRWKPGMTMHHWMHNPRNRSKNPYHFLTNECTGVQRIDIDPEAYEIRIDGKILLPADIEVLAHSDGLINERVLWEYFRKTGKCENWSLIHWKSTGYKFSQTDGSMYISAWTEEDAKSSEFEWDKEEFEQEFQPCNECDLPDAKAIIHKAAEMIVTPEMEKKYNEEATIQTEFHPCNECDRPDACDDFGCAIKEGIRLPPDW